MMARHKEVPVTVTILNPPSQAQLDRFWEGVARVCYRQAMDEWREKAARQEAATKTTFIQDTAPARTAQGGR